ncbi:hypothetical protein JW964_19140 [candidate division KSB1 bacterium]|nr:hypothetical protein [candidate division KSB1 bacterium]
MVKIDFAKIESVQPTIFLKFSPRGNNQIVDITLTNPRSEANASIIIKFFDQKTQRMIFGVKPGTATYKVEVPEIPETTEVTLDLSLDGKLQDQFKMKWPTVRRWEIHLVQFSHHNLNYTNLPTETQAEYDRYFNLLINYCEETTSWPEESQFRYTIETTAPLLHFIRHYSRRRVDELIKFIKNGRIEVAALFGNVISELCNSEELIRLLYPAFRLKHLYEIPVKTAMLNNISGINWGLATILADAGIKYFSPTFRFDSQHPYWDESTVVPKGRPDVFYWESRNAQKVLCWVGDEESFYSQQPIPDLETYLPKLEAQGYPFSVVRRLVTSAERDNAPPTKAYCEAVQKWNKEWAYPKLVMSTNTRFFEKLATELPAEIRTFNGGIPGTELPIAVTSMAQEVALNRQNQNQITTAEKFAAITSFVSDCQYPADEFRRAYEMLMAFEDQSWGQFHPFGPAQEATLAFKKQQAYYVAAQAHSILTTSLNKLADEITLSADAYHLVIFNPTNFIRTDVAHVDFMPIPPTGLPLCEKNPLTEKSDQFPQPLTSMAVKNREIITLPTDLVEKGFELIDLETQRQIPYQINEISEPGDAFEDAAHRYAFGYLNPLYRKKLLFVVKDVPALGYKVYQILPTERQEVIPKRVESSVKTIENKFYRLIVATNTGGLFSLFDKELERELVDNFSQYRVNQLFIHAIERDKIIKLENVNIRREQRGTISLSLIINGTMNGCPQCVQEITLYNDIKRIDFTNRILKDTTPLQELYFAFPFQMRNPHIQYENGPSVLDPARDLFPGCHPEVHALQNWLSLSDGEMTIAWTSFDAPIVRLGNLPNGNLSHFEPLINLKKAGSKANELTTGQFYSLAMSSNYRTSFPNVQLTDMLYRYSLTSFKSGTSEENARQFGMMKSSPLHPIFIKGPQNGRFELQQCFMTVSPANVKIITFKRAEFGTNFILRILEMSGQETEAELTIHFGKIQSVSRTNIVEENPQSLEQTDSHKILLKLKPSEIVTLSIALEKL